MDIDRLFAPFLLPEDEPSEETERLKAEVRKFLTIHDNLHRIVSSTEFLRAAVNNAAAFAAPVRAIPNDREKFNDWLDACPVEVTEIRNYAFGTVQVLFKLKDEEDE